MQGSRSGAVVATAWATMIYFGEEGYVAMAQRLHGGLLKLTHFISQLPGLKVGLSADSISDSISVVLSVARDGT